MTGCVSLEVTGLFSERSVVPAGTKNGPRGLPGDLFQVGAVDVPRRADEHRLGELELELLFPLLGRRRLGGSRGGEAGQEPGRDQDIQGFFHPVRSFNGLSKSTEPLFYNNRGVLARGSVGAARSGDIIAPLGFFTPSP